MKTVLVVQLAFLAMWVTNIYRLATCDFEPSYKAEAIYTLGVFTPTCLVTAWMDLED